MALPYTVTEKAFDAAVLTATKELKAEFSKCISKVIEVKMVGFSGTLDIQGKVDIDGTYANADYYLLSQGSAQTVSNAQLSYTAQTTSKRYLVVEYYPFLQLVMTRSAGSVSVHVVGIDSYVRPS